jgi:DmsE family decaheme c-type cytochrome
MALLAFIFASACASAANDRMARDRQCLACHDELEAKPIPAIYQTRHGVTADMRTPACQDCHGESVAHGKDKKVVGKRPLTDIPFSGVGRIPGSADARLQNQPCLKCHEGNSARHWWGSRHENQNLACASCHTLHSARDNLLRTATQADTCYRCHPAVRSETHRISAHPIASGKMTCRDCHDAHGGEGPKLTRWASLNDTCYDCHADKRGPFLWEHAPVSDDCMSCHTAHGGNHNGLLKVRQPWLCQECHSSTRHPSVAYSGLQLPSGGGNTASQIGLRGCANCHSRVHGSNHPSGARLLR